MHGDFVILHIIAMLLSHHISRFTGHIMLCMSLINSSVGPWTSPIHVRASIL